MRKIYSLVLMAAALLVGTNAWAENEIEIVRGGSTYNTYSHIEAAFKDALDGDLIRLTNDLTETFDSVAWFGETSSGTLVNYASTDRSITLDLMGHTYTLRKGTSASMIAFIIFTRGGLTIQSTGGDGVIMTPDAVDIFTITGTYLKIDAETQTPFTHLKVEQNVTLTSAKSAVCIETAVKGRNESDHWGRSYPLDYSCHFSPVSQQGVSNGVRLDIYGTLVGKKYGLKASGVLRIGREFLDEAGNYLDFIWSGSTKYTLGSTNYDKISSNPDVYYMPRGAKISEDVDAPYDGYQGEYIFTLNDDPYTPYIHIYPSALLKSNDPDAKTAVGFYCSGYCRAYVEGTCEGSTGVYVKSGEIELHDATVVSNYDHEYKGAANDLSTSGVNAGGSAIVIESKTGWTGNISVTISGDTHVSTDHGYAIDEQVTSGGTHVNYLTITGGTFEGGQVPVVVDGDTIGSTTGTMFVSQPTLDANQNPDTITTITILGATVSGSNTNYIGDADNQMTLADFLGGQGNTHVTYVTDENNNVTMVVSEGAGPTTEQTQNTWTSIASLAKGSNAAWTGTGDPADDDFVTSNGYGLISTEDTVKLGELQMISGTAANNKQVLVIQNGATLDVRHLMMNSYAQIIVEAGGKLIVEGTQGIIAPSDNNIILKTSETAQAIFLFNPAVTSNRHPKATVEFISKSYTNAQTAGNFVKQRFGIPTIGAVDTVYATGVVDDDYVGFQQYNYTSKQWELVGWLNHSTTSSKLKPADLNKPFISYMTQSFRTFSEDPTIITMTGSLVGNDDVDIKLAENAWIALSNSYTSDMYIKEMIDALPASVVQKAVYVSYTAGPGALTWTGYSASDYNGVLSERTDGMPQIDSLRPMQPFIIMNLGVATSFATNYNDMVWNPVFPSPSAPAPARTPKHFNNLTTAVVVLTDANGNYDRVRMISADEFTTDFDGEYDIIKYMNEAINIYVSADDKMETMTTDNLVNTYLGVAVNEAGNYTMSFNNIKGENLALIDLENNSVINMAKGNTYQFYAEGTNDYRFKIVARQEMPTDVETIDENVTMKAGGIYTLTGQYLGEMNIWNTLPNGLYIVNGEKKVK